MPVFYGGNEMKINWSNRLKNGAIVSSLVGQYYCLSNKLVKFWC